MAGRSGFQRLAHDAGLPRIRFHGLRHTSASLALAAGIPLKVVSDRLGHSPLGITADLYTHVLPAVASQAADAIGALLDQPRGGETGAPGHDVVGSSGGARESLQVRTGGPPGDRTQNPRIKSPLLCQLS